MTEHARGKAQSTSQDTAHKRSTPEEIPTQSQSMVDQIYLLQRLVGNRQTIRLLSGQSSIPSKKPVSPSIQRLPQPQGNNQWHDPSINNTLYPTLQALITANAVPYGQLNKTDTHQLLGTMRKHLSPQDLRLMINAIPGFRDKIVTNDPNAGVTVTLHIRVIRFPGMTAQVTDGLINEARGIYARFGIAIQIDGQRDVTQPEIAQGIPGLTNTGNYNSENTPEQDRFDLINEFQTGTELPIIWVNDFERPGGYGSGYNPVNWVTGKPVKPEGITTFARDLHAGPISNAVLMRPGRTGQVLAHEIGHALGSNILENDPDHGEHVDDFDQKNLMHSDPILDFMHKSLTREQVAAFKASPYVTLDP